MNKILVLESNPERQSELSQVPNTTVVTRSEEAILLFTMAEGREEYFSLVCFGDQEPELGILLDEYLNIINSKVPTIVHSWSVPQVEDVKKVLPKIFYFPYCESYINFLKVWATDGH